MIRGKIESDREWKPNKLIDDDAPFYEKDGKWYDKKTDEECVVTTFEEAYEQDKKGQ